MASDSASSLIQSTLWTNFIFIVVSAILLVSLLYQYVLPWYFALQLVKKYGRDPRPRVFFRFLLITTFALFIASILNVIFLAQDTPSVTPSPISTNEGPSMRIHNLSLNGWIALMVLATITRQLPYVLIFLTLLNILQSRWYAFTSATTGCKVVACTKNSPEVAQGDAKTDEHKFPAFLGWKGKEGTSFLLAFLLVFLPVLSRIILAVGLGTFPNPMRIAEGDFAAFEQLARVVAWLDALRAGTMFISVVDITVSSFFLSKRLHASGYRDSITSSVFRIFTPLMAAFAVQIVVASAIQTLGPTPTDYTLAAVGLSNVVVGGVITTFILVGLSVLYAALPRWMLAAPEEHPYALELPSLSKESV